ncbi:MAG: clan aspartic protease [Rhizobiaceae bacterium]|jgi:aspartyl protease family protein|nr:clan aspartic protease [Rhizobiaceae bacterium]
MDRIFYIILAILGGGLVMLLVADTSGTMSDLETGRFANLVYLGALATAIAAGILVSRQRFGDMARTLALWLLIVLVLMAGYEYRYELQDVASRVSGGLITGSPLSAEANGRATVTLRKRFDGHFAAPVAINGVTVEALVDTGATTSVLTADDAVRAGYDPQDLRFTIPVSTANGVANAARIVADEVVIGTISRKRLPLLVAEAGRLDQSLLGMNFIGSLSGFDVRGDRLILRD